MCCNIELDFRNIKIIQGIEKIIVCRGCETKYVEKIKSKYYIETYKGNEIYCKDGRYVPYWGCMYYFKNIEDCKKRIDHKYIGIYI